VLAEGSDPAAIFPPTKLCHFAGRAGDAAVVEVDIEMVLGDQPARSARRLGLARGFDAGIFESGQELTGAAGRVPVHRRDVVIAGLGIALRGLGIAPLWRRSSISSAATLTSAALPGVTMVLTIVSLSGSMAAWRL
jgi:hypothetical protein